MWGIRGLQVGLRRIDRKDEVGRRGPAGSMQRPGGVACRPKRAPPPTAPKNDLRLELHETGLEELSINITAIRTTDIQLKGMQTCLEFY